MVRPAVRRHGTWFGFLAVTVLVVSSCGAADRSSYENEAGRLRAEVQRVVDDTTREISGESGQSVQTVQQQLERHVPVPPTGQVLRLAGPATPGRARVDFALNGKIDDYGPGGTTATLRICVQVTMAPPPDLGAAIEDTDCSTLTPKADSLVKFRP